MHGNLKFSSVIKYAVLWFWHISRVACACVPADCAMLSFCCSMYYIIHNYTYICCPNSEICICICLSCNIACINIKLSLSLCSTHFRQTQMPFFCDTCHRICIDKYGVLYNNMYTRTSLIYISMIHNSFSVPSEELRILIEKDRLRNLPLLRFKTLNQRSAHLGNMANEKVSSDKINWEKIPESSQSSSKIPKQSKQNIVFYLVFFFLFVFFTESLYNNFFYEFEFECIYIHDHNKVITIMCVLVAAPFCLSLYSNRAKLNYYSNLFQYIIRYSKF